jgi:hypothetical protein
MNTILFRIATVIAAFFTLSCVNKITDKSPRFSRIFNSEIELKKPLYMYKIRYNPDGDGTYHNILSSQVTISPHDSGVLCILKPGQKVVFTKERTITSYSRFTWDLLGHTSLNGKTYPISYYLGWSGTDSTWRRIYEDFKIPLP